MPPPKLTKLELQIMNALWNQGAWSNAHIFEAVVTRDAAQGRLIDDLLSLFGGRTQPVMAHLVESGKLTMDDIEEARKALCKLAKKG